MDLMDPLNPISPLNPNSIIWDDDGTSRVATSSEPISSWLAITIIVVCVILFSLLMYFTPNTDPCCYDKDCDYVDDNVS